VDKETSFVTVSQVNGYLKEVIEGIADFRRLTVKGEVSNFKRYSNAAYFDLKDDKSVLPCVMWSDSLFYLSFAPKDGDEVLATGSIQVYQPRGRYQLYVSSLDLYGQGAELLRLEALKKKLAAEGLFDESRKRPLPSFPSLIGLIVGAGSAAEADLIKNLQRRWPLADIIVFPSLVQGTNAPKDLLRAYGLSKKYPLSTLIFARGGGSSEDLGAFNDEALVRAVSGSSVPTISAVGHEVDFTLLDYVVDKRVSTPTAAAEAATPDGNEIKERLDDLSFSLDEALKGLLETKKESVASLANRPFFKAPQSMYEAAKDKVKELGKRLDLAVDNGLAMKKADVARYEEHLIALNPYGVLKRGYSITEKEDGTVVKKKSDVKSGDVVKSRLEDGIITSKVL
jgi:exodeoxyribonuclease VII large subunit